MPTDHPHSAKLGRRLLGLHHDRKREDGRVLYPPKTEEAPLLWMHTGVCVKCHLRAIVAGRCIGCGHDHRD